MERKSEGRFPVCVETLQKRSVGIVHTIRVPLSSHYVNVNSHRTKAKVSLMFVIYLFRFRFPLV